MSEIALNMSKILRDFEASFQFLILLFCWKVEICQGTLKSGSVGWQMSAHLSYS